MQGKAFTKEQREVIIQSLQESLELGFSRNKACEMVGLAPGTLSNWVKADESLGMKLASWESKNNRLAMENIQMAMEKEKENENDTRKETSKWWAERRMKHDFSTKVESDVTTGGQPISLLGGASNDTSNDNNKEITES